MTRLIDVGEYGVHAWLRDTLSTSPFASDVGNDCAFLDLLPDQYLLVTSDRLPMNLTGTYAGRLVVTQNFSDIVCKGGRPIAFLLDVFMSREATFDEFQQIVLGAKQEAEKYGAFLVGGDTKEDKKLTVVGMAIGLVQKPHRVTRKGAAPGDLLAITLACSEKLGTRWAKVVADYFNLELPHELSVSLASRYANGIHLPAKEMQAAVATGWVTASIDNSDGLGGSLAILGRDSGVGFLLYQEQLVATLDPLASAVAKALDTEPLRFSFAPGYDWQCLLTTTAERFEEVHRAVVDVGGELVLIGEATSHREVLLRDEGRLLGRVSLFSDEKFKATPWEDQPREWLNFSLIDA